MKFKIDKKMGVAAQLQEVIYEAVCAAAGACISQKDIQIEHPAVEAFGDYSTNVAMVIYKSLGNRMAKRNFLENLEWLLRDVSKENFWSYGEALAVGRMKQEVREASGASEELVYLSPRVYAKVRGWMEGFPGHPEVSDLYWRLLPYFIGSPEAVLQDPKHENGRLFVFDTGQTGVVVLEVERKKGKSNEIATVFFTPRRRLAKLSVIFKSTKNDPSGGLASPSVLAPAERGGGTRFSTLREINQFYTSLDQKSQDEMLNFEKGWGDPRELAEKIVDELRKEPAFAESFGEAKVAEPGFINIWLKKQSLGRELVRVIDGGQSYGSSDIGKDKVVVIDYSAPNIAKPFGIGHLRSTIIGQALYDLYKFLGYRVIGDNHLGDWGTQFGKLLYMIETEKPGDLTIETLEKLYVEFHLRAENDPAIEEKGREWFKRLEDGDKKARALWQKCVDVSMAEFDHVYELLGVKIDFAYGESFYEGLMLEVIEEAKKSGVASQSDGAWVIGLPGIKTPLMLVKSDGATTYATRDLATLKFRKKEWDPDIVIYEVGAEQALHFMQVFAAARRLGYARRETELVHTKHGLYRWEHGKMRTREGNTVKLEGVLKEAIERAKKLGDQQDAAAVGIGAVKYFDLKHNVQSDIVFDWEKMFALEGDSGPYLQYTYARTQSVLKRAEDKNYELGIKNYEFNDEELAILRWIYRFPEVVAEAAQSFSPNLLCNFLFELAQRYNLFYQKHRILGEDVPENSSNLRLLLTAATGQVVKNGLGLLGIEAPERM